MRIVGCSAASSETLKNMFTFAINRLEKFACINVRPSVKSNNDYRHIQSAKCFSVDYTNLNRTISGTSAMKVTRVKIQIGNGDQWRSKFKQCEINCLFRLQLYET